MLLRYLHNFWVVLSGRVDLVYLDSHLQTTEVLCFHLGTLAQIAFSWCRELSLLFAIG